MSSLVQYALVSLGSVFSIVDPFAAVPVFLALTGAQPRKEQARTALRASATCFVVLTLFGLAGTLIFRFFGITLPAFKIAGGILLFLIALDMVFARQSGGRSTTGGEQEEARHKEDISVFPLAFPLIAGPGALTTILLMVWEAHGDPVYFTALIGVLLAILALTLGCLLIAGRLMKFLGQTGANVMDRLFGVILAALAVQFVIDGARAVFGPG